MCNGIAMLIFIVWPHIVAHASVQLDYTWVTHRTTISTCYDSIKMHHEVVLVSHNVIIQTIYTWHMLLFVSWHRITTSTIWVSHHLHPCASWTFINIYMETSWWPIYNIVYKYLICTLCKVGEGYIDSHLKPFVYFSMFFFTEHIY